MFQAHQGKIPIPRYRILYINKNVCPHFPFLHASSDFARAVTERRPPALAHPGRGPGK